MYGILFNQNPWRNHQARNPESEGRRVSGLVISEGVLVEQNTIWMWFLFLSCDNIYYLNVEFHKELSVLLSQDFINFCCNQATMMSHVTYDITMEITQTMLLGVKHDPLNLNNWVTNAFEIHIILLDMRFNIYVTHFCVQRVHRMCTVSNVYTEVGIFTGASPILKIDNDLIC